MHHFNDDQSISDSQQESLLDELEVRCRIDTTAIREAGVLHTRTQVAVRAGNCSQRRDLLTDVTTSEMTTTGLTGLAPRPLMVGDIYHLRFECGDLEVSPALAICERCTLLGEESFELRFRFMQSIELPNG